MSSYLVSNNSPTSRGQYTEVYKIDTEAAVDVTITTTNVKSVSSVSATPLNAAAGTAVGAGGFYYEITEGASTASVKVNVGANNCQYLISITGAI